MCLDFFWFFSLDKLICLCDAELMLYSSDTPYLKAKGSVSVTLGASLTIDVLLQVKEICMNYVA